MNWMRRISSLHIRALIAKSLPLQQAMRVLSSGAKLDLTPNLWAHVSRLMDQYKALVEKANSGSQQDLPSLYQSLSKLEPVVKLVQKLEGKSEEIGELQHLCSEVGDMKQLAQEELRQCNRELEQIKTLLIESVLPRDEADNHSAILEVRAGAGGVEASLFAAEIFQMYQRFAGYKMWAFEQLSIDRSDAGGYKHAVASVSGGEVFGMLKHEVGVHRVQRVPITEGMGRVHTSTMSIVILPQPTQIEVEISPSDIKIDTMRASGAGGQHVNTTDSAIRLTHLPTGIVISIQDEKSQHKNRAKAMKILHARLYEQKRQRLMQERSEQRRQQMGTQERFEKIRTYNFPQDRVTDHRLGYTTHGVEEFLSGGDTLDTVIAQLRLREEEELIIGLSGE
ncbi:peptide chain release factor 1-like isoform X2 [Halichondria panicea]|uniref:peptide chain release factor 1-like isoform X2 n=1 Tax=Halichondria panicea TaxID=6063 RepID=UPI00312BA1CB